MFLPKQSRRQNFCVLLGLLNKRSEPRRTGCPENGMQAQARAVYLEKNRTIFTMQRSKAWLPFSGNFKKKSRQRRNNRRLRMRLRYISNSLRKNIPQRGSRRIQKLSPRGLPFSRIQDNFPLRKPNLLRPLPAALLFHTKNPYRKVTGFIVRVREKHFE